MFAVGAYATILHFDGTGWRRQEPGEPAGAYLTDVWGDDAGATYAVGSLALRSDGSGSWRPEPVGTSVLLTGVAGHGSCLVAIGHASTILSRACRFDPRPSP